MEAGLANYSRGYVALAVVAENAVKVKEVETGSADREANMLAFALEALKLLLEVINSADVKL